MSDDAVFITGHSTSPTLPGTTGGFQENNASSPGQADAFVARLSTDLATLEQATWLGGPINESAFGMAQAPNGIIYVGGYDESPGFPGVGGGAIDDFAGGDSDGFLAAMSPDLALVAPEPSISISDFSANEGNGGSTIFTFNVTLSSAPGTNVSVLVQSVPGTATANTDYLTLFPTTLVFTPFGSLTRQVTVQVAGDFDQEPNEQFTVTLTNPNGVTIADGTGLGTIVNDDAVAAGPAEVPTLSFAALMMLALAIGAAAVMMIRS
ncbi:MAG TPA: Calx-beta domain-containing protein [Thermoanaerobaculia bacterium]|nr:Calx-beta domain-containing protein [Thermoanaerobaculia bacterium]